MSKLVYIMNGPNLNLLGKRQPEIYGSDTLEDVVASCSKVGAEFGITCKDFQSNSEGELVSIIHQAREEAAAIIINPGAYSHTSVAIFDALQTFEGIVMEVHISNIHKRESFRHHSYVSMRADGIVVGCGVEGYALAMRRIGGLLV